MPEDSKAAIINNKLTLPVGSVLIKNFYYPEDFSKPEGKKANHRNSLNDSPGKGLGSFPLYLE